MENDEGSNTWVGRFVSQKWICSCDRTAVCRTVKANNSNQGRRFWKCPKDKSDPTQCNLFILCDDEERAKIWTRKNNPQLEPEPETPTRTISSNPFTKSKRKRLASRDISDDQEISGDLDPENFYAAEDDTTEEEAGPSHKVAKTAHFFTPGQTFNERLLSIGPSSLPTPQTHSHNTRHRQDTNNNTLLAAFSPESTPTPSHPPSHPSHPSPSLNTHTISDPTSAASLTQTILKLIHSDRVILMESTKIKIRHEISREIEMGRAIVRNYERTVGELCEKLDELEKVVRVLTNGGAVDDEVLFSD